MSSAEFKKSAEMAAKKRSQRETVENILLDRASERFEEPDGLMKFADAFEKHPDSVSLTTILDEGVGDEEVSNDLWTLYKAQLRKFEADFLRAHSDQIDPHVILKMLTYDASLEVFEDLEEKHNLSVLEDFGVSTKFRLGK